MSLALPMANATLTQHFANQSLAVEPKAYHIGAETCMFNFYPGAVVAAHFHMGTDWAAAKGSAVLACEAGSVEYAGWAVSPGPFGGGGNIVVVGIAGGMFYMVAHLSSINVAAGQTVARGQRLGTQGHSGTATGDHVHLSIYTETATRAKLFHNPEHYLAGGKYADSPLIAPAALPDTSTEDDMATYAEIYMNHNPKRIAHFAAKKSVQILTGLKPKDPRSTFTPAGNDAYGTDAVADVSQDPAGFPSGWYARINAAGSGLDDHWVALRDITLDPDTPCT